MFNNNFARPHLGLFSEKQSLWRILSLGRLYSRARHDLNPVSKEVLTWIDCRLSYPPASNSPYADPEHAIEVSAEILAVNAGLSSVQVEEAINEIVKKGFYILSDDGELVYSDEFQNFSGSNRGNLHRKRESPGKGGQAQAGVK